MRGFLWWGLSLALWLLFTWWYSNTGGPLTAAEVDHYLGLMEQRGTDPETADAIRTFLENDTGDDFAMLNVIEMNHSVPDLQGLGLGATPQDALDAYMTHMYPALFSRACHPVMVGTAAASAVDVWGIDRAREWTQGALLRYRSRRDMMEIATDPEFSGPHEYKIAAMSKTVAFPLDPWFQAGDPRLLLGLVLLVFALVFGRPATPKKRKRR